MTVIMGAFHAQILFLAGCALLTIILLRRSYRYFGRRKRFTIDRPIESVPRPLQEWSGAHSDMFARIEREKVEMHRLARDLTGRIDSKLLLLEELIETSRQQIDVTRRTLRELEVQQSRIDRSNPS